MKFFNALAALPLSVPLSQAFWTRLYSRIQLQAPAWLRIPTRTNLPLFIHDLRHPWIEHNIRWLERRPDPMNDLCDPDSALRNGDVEGRAIPSDLFSRLDIDNNRYGINREGWPNMRDRLAEILACPAALQQVTYLYIDVYVSDGEWMNPGEKIIESMANALSAMTNLRVLRWGIPSLANEYFSEVFARRGLQLPSIEHLVVGAYAQHMVSVCPHLKKLEGGGYEHHWSWANGPLDRDHNPAKLLLQEASRAPSITSLSFQDRRRHWDKQLVRDVIEAIPNLTNLSMLGEIANNRYESNLRDDYLDDGFGIMDDKTEMSSFPLVQSTPPDFKTLLRELKAAPHLSHLRVPEASELGLGFDGGAWCGNAYFGPGGREYGRQVEKRGIEAIEKAAKIVFEILPHLQSLEVGGTSPLSIIRDEAGNLIDLKWAWTDRMQEYLYEVWPEPKKGTWEYDHH